MSIPIVSGFHISSPGHIDDRYSDNGLPYSTTSSAIAAIPNYRYIGLTVLVGSTSSTPYPQEYWWQNGISDSQLVLKQSVGNIIGSASSGYITVWSGTTSITYTPNLYYNSNGLLIGTNSSYGSYSLQVNGSTIINGSNSLNIWGTYSVALYLNGTSSYGIWSQSINSAFRFENLTTASLLSGTTSQTNPILQLQTIASSYDNTNVLALRSTPLIGNGGTGVFSLINFQSSPNFSTLSCGSSLEQSYSYRDYNQFVLGLTNSYRKIGGFGLIYESGTFSYENTSFRWSNSINGTIYENMRLLGSNLLIGYTQSQGTYSLQVNGSSLINGNSSTNSYMIYGNSSALVLSGNSNYGIYSHSVNAGFSFFNQIHSNVLSGSSNAILDIQQTSNTAGPYGIILRTIPYNMTNGGTGSFNLLNFLSSPGSASGQGLQPVLSGRCRPCFSQGYSLFR